MIEQDELNNFIMNKDLAIKLFEALERLDKNSDFQLLIEEGFFTKYVKNQMSLLKAEGNEGNRGVSIENLAGVSVLKNYLVMVENIGKRFKEESEEAQYEEHVG